MSEEEIMKFLSCDNCKFATCEQCEINQTTKKAIKELIEKQQEQLENSVSKDKIRNDMNFLEEIGEVSIAYYLKDLL